MSSNFYDQAIFAAAKIESDPTLLNFEQKQRRMDIAQEMFTIFNDDPNLLKKLITSDESWMYGYDIETKVQTSQWKRCMAAADFFPLPKTKGNEERKVFY